MECAICASELANYLSFVNHQTSNIIDEKIIETIKKYDENIETLYLDYEIDSVKLKHDLKNIMWEYVGILRDEKNLKLALYKINDLENIYSNKYKCATASHYELRNLIMTAKIIVLSAIKRKESRGAHFRVDYPTPLETAKHSITNMKEILDYEKTYVNVK